MTLVLVLLVLAAVAAAVAVGAGRLGGGMGPVTSTRPFVGLPPGEVRPSDVDDVRFSVGLRGYRMDEVDAVLARLREELRERDDELAAWREEPGDELDLRDDLPGDDLRDDLPGDDLPGTR
ncbi:DivIVA domain-containing protein [Kineococcus glutinatus]|uniref:DivIVA domain-containing protein n=1 Tax=Kineococcus glutinatus TaxID=1070872 RepID=A0ABP8VFI9_9ACTN